VHTRIIEQLDKGSLLVSHFLFHLIVYGISKFSHISFFNSACLVMALSVVFSMILIEMILRSVLTGRYSDYFVLFVAMSLMFVSSIYFPWKNIFPYKGIWSPNPWHNPTFIVARPFALLIFHWYSLEMIKETYFKKRFSVMRIAILLAICALIKPNFILAFIPASLFFCLFFLNRKKTMLLKTGLLLLPTLGVLAFQFLFTYFSDIQGDSAVRFCFFDIWYIYAQSAPLAILQGTAFPLTILSILFYYMRNDKSFSFNWILFIIGFLISGILCETGHREGHANFIWTYMFCLNILFIYSTIAFLRWVVDVQENTRLFQLKIFFCISTFLLHFFSGIYYVGYLISGYLL
jgi:hypothetical protein